VRDRSRSARDAGAVVATESGSKAPTAVAHSARPPQSRQEAAGPSEHQHCRPAASTRATLPQRNARSHADRRDKGYRFAPAMQHRIAVSQDRAGCKHGSSSLLAVDHVAGSGAERSRQQL
jgi:hypothetical protein